VLPWSTQSEASGAGQEASGTMNVFTATSLSWPTHG